MAKLSLMIFPGGKDYAGSWLQYEISRYLAVLVVACGSCSIVPGSLVTMGVIECEKKWDNGVSTVMKLIVDLDLGHYSLGSEGSNARRVEATP